MKARMRLMLKMMPLHRRRKSSTHAFRVYLHVLISAPISAEDVLSKAQAVDVKGWKEGDP